MLRTKRNWSGSLQQPGGGAREAAEILPAHRADRAELDHHLEHLAGRAAEADQVDDEDQMAGRGHRQELGQALDDAEQQRPEQELQIHRVSFWLARRRATQGAGALAQLAHPRAPTPILAAPASI